MIRASTISASTAVAVLMFGCQEHSAPPTPPGSSALPGEMGPAGGMVEAGPFTLVVPPGALNETVRISIQPSPGAPACQPVAEFSPDGFTFDRDVSLQVSLPSHCASPRAVVHVAHWSGGRWERLVTQWDGAKATAKVRHFSSYGVVTDVVGPFRVSGEEAWHNGLHIKAGGAQQLSGLYTGRDLFLVLHRDPQPSTLEIEGLGAGRSLFVRIQDAPPIAIVTVNAPVQLALPPLTHVSVTVLDRPGTRVLASAADCQDSAAAALRGNMVGDTCVLLADVNDSIAVVGNFSLNCAGHRVTGAGPAVGITVGRVDRASVVDCTVSGFQTGIFLAAEHAVIRGNRLDVPAASLPEQSVGVLALGSKRAEILDNSIRGVPSTGIAVLPAFAADITAVRANSIEGAGVGVAVASGATAARVETNVINAAGAAVSMQHDLQAPGPVLQGNTLLGTGMAAEVLAVGAVGPGGERPPLIFHNNMTAAQGVLSISTATGLPHALELSDGTQGNYWNRSLPPLFQSSDSNDPSVMDSHPYCAQSAWDGGGAPQYCSGVLTAPVITFPPDGSTLFEPVSRVSGTSTAASVTLVVGSYVQEAATLMGRFEFLLPTALGAGGHRVNVTASEVSGGVPATSLPAESYFWVDLSTASAGVNITYPRQGQVVRESRPPLVGVAPPLSSITVTIGATTSNPVRAGANGGWSLEFPAELPNGSHTATAHAQPAGGAVLHSGPVTFTISSAEGALGVDGSGRIGVRLVAAAPSVVYVGTGSPAQSEYELTGRTLPANTNQRMAFGVLTERLFDASTGVPYRTLQAVFDFGGSAANQPFAANQTLIFDGRGALGNAPSRDTALTRDFNAAVGWVQWTPRNSPNCVDIDPNSPRDPFSGTDFSGLHSPGGPDVTLRFCALKETEFEPGPEVIVTPTPNTGAARCDGIGALEPNLGGISRVLPDLRFCCLPGTSQSRVSLLVQHEGGRSAWFLTPEHCTATAPGEDFCAPAAPPLSAMGWGCVEEVGRSQDGLLSICRLHDVDLYPQALIGEVSPQPSSDATWVREGPIHIQVVAGDPTNPARQVTAEFDATLGTFKTPLDGDGDSYRDRFESCPARPDELAGSRLCGTCRPGQICSHCKSRKLKDTAPLGGDCISDACDCFKQEPDGGILTDTPCNAGTACDPNGTGLCLAPPPRVPSVTPESRGGLGTRDPLSGNGAANDQWGHGLETDDAKGASIAITPDGRTTVFGHVSRECGRVSVPNTPPDGGMGDAGFHDEIADCPFPHAVQWKGRVDRRGPGWARLDLANALPDYWNTQLTLAGIGPSPGAGNQADFLRALTGDPFTRQGHPLTQLKSTGAITPRFPVVTMPDGAATFLLVGMRDATSHPFNTASPPAAPLQHGWFHGVPGMMGNLYVLHLTNLANIPGQTLTTRAVHVPTGLSYQDALGLHGDSWVATVSMALDPVDQTLWLAAACGAPSNLCVHHLDGSGAPISSRVVSQAGQHWFDTSITVTQAGVYLAGQRVRQGCGTCTTMADTERVLLFLTDTGAQLLDVAGGGSRVAPLVVSQDGRTLLLDTVVMDNVVPASGGGLDNTGGARVSSQMKTVVEVSRIGAFGLEAWQTWEGLIPLAAPGDPAFWTTEIQPSPLAALRPGTTPQGKALLAAGDFLMRGADDPAASVLMHNVNVGAFAGAVATRPTDPPMQLYLAKNGATREYRTQLEGVTKAVLTVAEGMVPVSAALANVPAELDVCATAGQPAGLAGGLLALLSKAGALTVPSNSFAPPAVDFGFVAGTHWLLRASVNGDTTTVAVEPLGAPTPEEGRTPVTDLTLISTTDRVVRPTASAGFVHCPVSGGGEQGCVRADELPVANRPGRVVAFQVCEKEEPTSTAPDASGSKMACLQIGADPGTESITETSCGEVSNTMDFQVGILVACRLLNCAGDSQCERGRAACNNFDATALVPSLADITKGLSSSNSDQTVTVQSLAAEVSAAAPASLSAGPRGMSLLQPGERELRGSAQARVVSRCFRTERSLPDLGLYVTQVGDAHYCWFLIDRAFEVSLDVDVEFSVKPQNLIALGAGYGAEIRGDLVQGHYVRRDSESAVNVHIRSFGTNLNPVDNAVLTAILESQRAQLEANARDQLIGAIQAGLFDVFELRYPERLTSTWLSGSTAYTGVAYEDHPRLGAAPGANRVSVHQDRRVFGVVQVLGIDLPFFDEVAGGAYLTDAPDALGGSIRYVAAQP